MILDNKMNQRVSSIYGEKMIAVVAKYKSDFRQYVKDNGKPGCLYAHCNKLKHITGCSFHSIEYGNFSTGMFGVSSKLLEQIKLRLIPVGTIQERQKEYLEKYSMIVVEYADGSRKDFTPDEWGLYEEGIRKIANQIIFITL